MKFQLTHSFRDYVASGDETTKELLDSGSPLVAAIEEIHDFFRDDLWADETKMHPTQALLSTNAFMIYLSAVRVAMTGHEVAIFPLFRTALESACYAYRMGEDESLQRIWADRHRSAKAMKLCRRKFSSAVAETARAIEAVEQQEGPAKWINDCYQGAIDFGAHPNPRSIYPHVGVAEEEDAYLVSLAALYSSDSMEVSRSLMACLDYGVVIAVVLAHGLKSPTHDLSEKLSRLNDTKERLTQELFPEAHERIARLR
jgi:hypothetical protein